MHARRIRRSSLAVISTLTVVLVLCAALVWGATDLLGLLPAPLLGCLLLARRYPGERLLLRRACPLGARRPRAPRSSTAPQRVAVRMPRGGRLIGFALAVRPPPRAPAAI